jgi:DNA-binding transcriptional ArsR family regulator
MSVDIDITGLPPERLVFSPSPLAELSSALHVLAEPGHHPALHGWATATAAGLKADLADRLHEAHFLWSPTVSDVFNPFAGLPSTEGRPGATMAEELDHLDRLDDERFVASALEFTCSAAYECGGPSPLVDGHERDRALGMAAARGPRQLEFARRLLADPPALRAWIRRLFEDCEQAFFADLWQRLRVELAADARHKTDLLRHKGLAAAFSAVSPAVTLSDDARRIRVDKLSDGSATALDPDSGPGVTFVPTSLGRPHLLVLYARKWRPVILYPVAAPELRPTAPVRVVQQRLEVLAHPARMRLARFLARAPYTTGELADAMGISAPEVSRHLTQMKKADLLTTRRRGRYVLHQLDLRIVVRLGADYLEGVLR